MPNQWWRFITPIFLHAGLVHLLVNMFVQCTVGAQVRCCNAVSSSDSDPFNGVGREGGWLLRIRRHILCCRHLRQRPRGQLCPRRVTIRRCVRSYLWDRREHVGRPRCSLEVRASPAAEGWSGRIAAFNAADVFGNQIAADALLRTRLWHRPRFPPGNGQLRTYWRILPRSAVLSGRVPHHQRDQAPCNDRPSRKRHRHLRSNNNVCRADAELLH